MPILHKFPHEWGTCLVVWSLNEISVGFSMVCATLEKFWLLQRSGEVSTVTTSSRVIFTHLRFQIASSYLTRSPNGLLKAKQVPNSRITGSKTLNYWVHKGNFACSYVVRYCVFSILLLIIYIENQSWVTKQTVTQNADKNWMNIRFIYQ